MKRYSFLIIVAALAVGFVFAGKNDNVAKWPQKTIQIIVPFKAGGDTDFNARTYAKFLEQELKVSVVVVNVDGSGGTVGNRQVKDARPDGYTVLFNQTPFLITIANGMQDFGFDAYKVVGAVGENGGYVYCVSPKLGVKTIKDLIRLSNSPGKDLKIAMNVGGVTQIFAYMLQDAGVKCTQVDIAGANDKAVACIGGHVDIISLPYGNVKQYIQSGDLVPLAYAGDTRNSSFSDIPTAKEQGFELSFPNRYFFAFPKNTDQIIVDKFAKAIENICKNNAEYAKMIKDTYQQEPFFLNADDAVAYFNKQLDLIKKYRLK